MPSLNRVMLIGHLGADPEMKYTGNGTAVTNFNMATTEKWTDKSSGEKQESTQWHRIVLWSKQAELAKEYLHKGSLVYIEGRLQTRDYEDKDGIKRYVTEIIGSQMQFMDSKPSGAKKPDNEEELPFD